MVHVSVFMLIPHYFDYYCLVIQPESRKCDVSSVCFFFLRIALASQFFFAISHIHTCTHTHTHTQNGMFSIMRKKEISSFTKTWMNFKDIRIREVSQAEKNKYCTYHIYVQFIETENKMMVIRVGEMGKYW